MRFMMLVKGNADYEADAVRMARDFMQLHADVLGPAYSGELEVRQMAGEPPCTQP